METNHGLQTTSKKMGFLASASEHPEPPEDVRLQSTGNSDPAPTDPGGMSNPAFLAPPTVLGRKIGMSGVEREQGE